MADHAKCFIAVRWQTCFSRKRKIQSNIRLPTLKTKLNQLLQRVLGIFKVWMFKNGKFLNKFLGSVSDSWWWEREEDWFSCVLVQGAAGPQTPRGWEQNRDAWWSYTRPWEVWPDICGKLSLPLDFCIFTFLV